MRCQGENCTSTDGNNHSVECLFEHFLSYMNAWGVDPDIMGKLKKAYFDGYEAGLHRKLTSTISVTDNDA